MRKIDFSFVKTGADRLHSFQKVAGHCNVFFAICNIINFHFKSLYVFISGFSDFIEKPGCSFSCTKAHLVFYFL